MHVAKAEMVKLAMTAFDYSRYLNKLLDRVIILEDKELIGFYIDIANLAENWHPMEIIDNFDTT